MFKLKNFGIYCKNIKQKRRLPLLIQVIQMAKYLDTIYVSGWQSSSTASTSNEPGPDLADYPMVK